MDKSEVITRLQIGYWCSENMAKFSQNFLNFRQHLKGFISTTTSRLARYWFYILPNFSTCTVGIIFTILLIIWIHLGFKRKMLNLESPEFDFSQQNFSVLFIFNITLLTKNWINYYHHFTTTYYVNSICFLFS